MYRQKIQRLKGDILSKDAVAGPKDSKDREGMVRYEEEIERANRISHEIDKNMQQWKGTPLRKLNKGFQKTKPGMKS